MKFRPDKITLSLGDTAAKNATRVNGYVGEFFGVHKAVTTKAGSSISWTVTHLPTGMRVTPDWDSESEALHVAGIYEEAFSSWKKISWVRAELADIGCGEYKLERWPNPPAWPLFRDLIECAADGIPSPQEMWDGRKRKK